MAKRGAVCGRWIWRTGLRSAIFTLLLGLVVQSSYGCVVLIVSKGVLSQIPHDISTYKNFALGSVVTVFPHLDRRVSFEAEAEFTEIIKGEIAPGRYRIRFGPSRCPLVPLGVGPGVFTGSLDQDGVFRLSGHPIGLIGGDE